MCLDKKISKDKLSQKENQEEKDFKEKINQDYLSKIFLRSYWCIRMIHFIFLSTWNHPSA